MIFFRTTLQSRLFTGFAVTIFFSFFIIKSLFFILFSIIILIFYCIFSYIFFKLYLNIFNSVIFTPSFIYIFTKLLHHAYTVICWASLPISVSVQNSSLIYTLSYVEHTFLYLYLYKTNKHIFSNYFHQLIINTTQSYAFYIF